MLPVYDVSSTFFPLPNDHQILPRLCVRYYKRPMGLIEWLQLLFTLERDWNSVVGDSRIGGPEDSEEQNPSCRTPVRRPGTSPSVSPLFQELKSWQTVVTENRRRRQVGSRTVPTNRYDIPSELRTVYHRVLVETHHERRPKVVRTDRWRVWRVSPGLESGRVRVK